MITETVVDMLMDARDLISDPKHWTCGTAARDTRGRTTLVRFATSFCSMGALMRVAEERDIPVSLLPSKTDNRFLDCLDLLNDAHRNAGAVSAVNGNDNNDHQFALDRFDDAIRMAKDQL